jgi:uncharacterized protein YgiM (DUF1202 family)
MSSASETIAQILRINVIGHKTGLNVRVQPREDSSVVAVVHAGTKLAVTKTLTNGFRYLPYHGQGCWVKKPVRGIA